MEAAGKSGIRLLGGIKEQCCMSCCHHLRCGGVATHKQQHQLLRLMSAGSLLRLVV